MSKLVHFNVDFDYHPSNNPHRIYAYPANTMHDVSDECAEWAIWSGCGVEVVFEHEETHDDDGEDDA